MDEKLQRHLERENQRLQHDLNRCKETQADYEDAFKRLNASVDELRRVLGKGYESVEMCAVIELAGVRIERCSK